VKTPSKPKKFLSGILQGKYSYQRKTKKDILEEGDIIEIPEEEERKGNCKEEDLWNNQINAFMEPYKEFGWKGIKT
jgi:hypothetical protein